MRKKVVLVAFLLALLAGCQMTPRQKFVAGCQSYRAVSVLFVQARESGVIESDAAWAEILKADAIVYEALVAFKLAIDSGRPSEAEWEAFNAALDKFLEIYQRLPEPADKQKPDGPAFMEVATWQPKR